MDSRTLAHGLHTETQPNVGWRPERCDQIALVFQGGGALGAYQAGVYQALHEAGGLSGSGSRNATLGPFCRMATSFAESTTQPAR